MGTSSVEQNPVVGSAENPFRVPLSSRYRIPLVLVVYTLGLALSLWLAYQLRFDFAVPPLEQRHLYKVAIWTIPLKLTLLLLIGQFAGLLSYFSIPELRRLVLALFTGSCAIGLVWFVTTGTMAPPRSVILADFLLSSLSLAAIRVCFRLVREKYLDRISQRTEKTQRIAIIGAGDVGAALARELSMKARLGLRPVAFFDDDSEKWNSRIHEIPVVGRPERLLEKKGQWKLDKAIIAMPSAPGKRIREVVHILQHAKLNFETVPSLNQLATGQFRVSQIRPVDIEDLLGREPVELETENIRGVLKGKRVMVTGAGGSIGSELCRQIASFGPSTVLLVERSEVQLFRIEQELIGLGHGKRIVPLIADVLDEPRLRSLFETHRPEVVFHAAAHKHVPMMESQPCEAIKNNTFGTVQVAKMSWEFGVERFVLISTDKSINPTSVMGATKRLAEVFLQWFAVEQTQPQRVNGEIEFNFMKGLRSGKQPRTKFMAVRFGNVLDSSGSVIPTFKAQIAAGGPVTVTHPEVVRYFMTIPEAVGLVLQSAAQGRGGEIFVLDMGNPVKIVDLARQLIELSGLKPGEDIEIKFVGLRPGEKLFEELNHEGENILPTNHPKIMRFIAGPVPHRIEDYLDALWEELHEADPNDLKLLLRQFVSEYRPYLGSNGTAGENRSSVEPKLSNAPQTPTLV